jgi:hypothetical protein
MSQEKTNTDELNQVASLVEDYCTTSETTTSMAVKCILLELKLAKAENALLEHKLSLYENSGETPER